MNSHVHAQYLQQPNCTFNHNIFDRPFDNGQKQGESSMADGADFMNKQTQHFLQQQQHCFSFNNGNSGFMCNVGMGNNDDTCSTPQVGSNQMCSFNNNSVTLLQGQQVAFLFNSDMANKAAKFIRETENQEMTAWHSNYFRLVPSTSFEQTPHTRPIPSPRGTKRKQEQQSHSFSPHCQPPHTPQSVPAINYSHLSQQSDPANRSSPCPSNRQLTTNQANYMNAFGGPHMEENPLKKMEIMATKTLSEPTNNKLMSREDEEGQGQKPAEILKQEKMRKLQEIEKSLLLTSDGSPTFTPNCMPPFPDPTFYRPPFMAPGHLPPQFSGSPMMMHGGGSMAMFSAPEGHARFNGFPPPGGFIGTDRNSINSLGGLGQKMPEQ